MYKSFKNKQGFTILELLIGLSIGIIVLTGLMSFFFRTSKMIEQEQNSVKTLSQLQFVMNKMVQDIKEANTELPGAGTTMIQAEWNNLPHLPYCRSYTGSITETQTERISPAYPVAFNFPNQPGTFGLPEAWYPKRDTSNETEALHYPESNGLAFYKLVNNKITRVRYYAEPDSNDSNNPKSLVIKRTQQFASDSNRFNLSNNFEDENLKTNKEIILKNVKALQFFYPNLSKRLESSSPDYDSAFRSEVLASNDATPSVRGFFQSKILNQYRDTISIKIITAGKQISDYRATALELTTEVNIRN